MGGSAFSQGPNPLNTPRMPSPVFHHMSEECKKSLRQLFLCVASPIEAPCKSDHGDLDIFVAWPISSGHGSGILGVDAGTISTYHDTIGLALGAEGCKKNGNIANYAIPWPEHLSSDQASLAEQPKSKPYIQVDVTVAESLEEMQWFLFKHAHGDIWSLLGSIIRPYGLTIDEQGLFIRIPEIEKSNRKMAKIRLTSEPTEVLSFLGLPFEGFWERPFSTIDQMFEYVSQCRMFQVYPASKEGPNGERLGQGEAEKSDDRKRMKTRPIFHLWMTTFLSSCRLEGRFLDARTSRDDVRREALERFQVHHEYQYRLDQFVREMQVSHIKKDIIKATFPAPDPQSAAPGALQYRGCLVKALARIVLDDDTTYGVFPDPAHPLKDARGIFDLDNVRRFINLNHESVGAAAMELHHQARLDKKQDFQLTATIAK